MSNEKWITIKNFPNYKISNLGRVKSFKHSKPIILFPVKKGVDTYAVKLYKNGIGYSFTVGRLLFFTWGIGEIDNTSIHLNEQKLLSEKIKRIMDF